MDKAVAKNGEVYALCPPTYCRNTPPQQQRRRTPAHKTLYSRAVSANKRGDNGKQARTLGETGLDVTASAGSPLCQVYTGGATVALSKDFILEPPQMFAVSGAPEKGRTATKVLRLVPRRRQSHLTRFQIPGRRSGCQAAAINDPWMRQHLTKDGCFGKMGLNSDHQVRSLRPYLHRAGLCR